MKKITEEQFEQEMNIISNLKEVSAPSFFYTRLIARIEKVNISNDFTNPLQPIMIICALTLFLIFNSLLLKNESNMVNIKSDQEIDAFAASYDQTVSN